jgi:hypothetical protein
MTKTKKSPTRKYIRKIAAFLKSLAHGKGPNTLVQKISTLIKTWKYPLSSLTSCLPKLPKTQNQKVQKIEFLILNQ